MPKFILANVGKISIRKYCIERGRTCPHHQSSNYSEGEGGNRKYWLVKLLHLTPHAPPNYWCFGLNFLNTVSKCLSKHSLNGQCPAEMVKGETPDISIFCFPWFSPVWFYAPNLDFPTDRMRPGFFLDIAHNFGGGFSYELLAVKTILTSRNTVVCIQLFAVLSVSATFLTRKPRPFLRKMVRG